MKVCEEGIGEGRYKFVEVRIEELRVFLIGLELAEVRMVQKEDDEKLHTKLTSLSASRTRTRRLIAVLPDLVVFHRKGFNDCERSSMKSAAFLCSLTSSSSDASMAELWC